MLAFLAQVLVGMAFATAVYGFSARLTNERAFGVLFRLGVIPLFLFSGAFFPITNLGRVLELGRPAHAAVARRRPRPGCSASTPSTGRLAAINVAVPAWRCACSAGAGRSTGLTKRLVK